MPCPAPARLAHIAVRAAHLRLGARARLDSTAREALRSRLPAKRRLEAFVPQVTKSPVPTARLVLAPSRIMMCSSTCRGRYSAHVCAQPAMTRLLRLQAQAWPRGLFVQVVRFAQDSKTTKRHARARQATAVRKARRNPKGKSCRKDSGAQAALLSRRHVRLLLAPTALKAARRCVFQERPQAALVVCFAWSAALDDACSRVLTCLSCVA